MTTLYPYLKEGYAAGTTSEGKWLTVVGSTYDSRLVYATKAEANARADSIRSQWAEPHRSAITVQRVRRVFHGGVSVTNEAYLIIEE